MNGDLETRKLEARRKAAALIRRVVAGSAAHADLDDEWPQLHDATLEYAREAVALWWLPEVRQDPLAQAELQGELERILAALGSGADLVPPDLQRSWELSRYLRDNAVGIGFVLAAMALLGGAVWLIGELW